jgi:ectoine hydroxylase-related dioxygenase (phytanoyl-CoA dioxygenase family)
MLTETQIAQFNTNGFLNGGKILDDAQVEILRDELSRVIENHDSLERKPVLFRNLSGNDDAPVWQIVNIWEASDPYANLVHHPKIAEDMAQLTGAQSLRIWHDQIQFKPAETGGVNWWHQDAPLWTIIAPMTEVSAWVALDDVDESNGCMSMVPGSHLWGNNIDFLKALDHDHFDGLPAEFEGHNVKIHRCPVQRGEVHFHHALTWHGSHANSSGRPRRAVALHFMTGDTRFVASGEHPMKQFVEVADGELMCGAHFPLIYP